MRVSLLVLLAVLQALALKDPLQPACVVDTVRHHARSADVVIHPQSLTAESVLLLSSAERVDASLPIQDTDFLEHVVGSAAERSHLMLFVDGGVSQLPHTEQHAMLQRRRVRVQASQYPADALSSMTSMLTGCTASEHGIVAAEWRTPNGQVLSAYKADALRACSSIADTLASSPSPSQQQQRLVLSFSSQHAYAAAGSIHPATESAVQTHTLAWEFSSRTVNATLSEKKVPQALMVSAEDLLNVLASLEHVKGVRAVKLQERIYQVSLQSGEQTTFNVDNQADAAFLAELAFAARLPGALKSLRNIPQDASSHGASSDLVVLSFASLRQFAAQSSSLPVATALLDVFINTLIEGVRAEYGEIGVSVTALTKSTKELFESNLPRVQSVAFNAVSHAVASKAYFDRFFPSVYVLPEHQRSLPALCDRLRSKLSGMDVEVSCNVAEEGHLRARQDDNSTTPAPPPATSGSLTGAVELHTVLWISILLGLALIGTVYAIAYMDVGEDSLLYRLTSIKQHQL